MDARGDAAVAPKTMSAVGRVAGLLGMSAETLRLWQRRYEVDAGGEARAHDRCR